MSRNKLKKRYYTGTVLKREATDNVPVYLVDASYIRSVIDSSFEYYGTSKVHSFIPEGEIWIDSSLEEGDIALAIEAAKIEHNLIVDAKLDKNQARRLLQGCSSLWSVTGGENLVLSAHLLDENAHHDKYHKISSHDTSATGVELDVLTGGDDATLLHQHDTRYHTKTELGSTDDESAGVSLIGVGAMDNPPVPLTKETLRDFINTTQHAGVITDSIISDNGDGTIAISAGEALIKVSDDPQANIVWCSWEAMPSLSLTNYSINHIYVDYNNGSPVVAAATDMLSINNYSQVFIGRVYRCDDELCILEAREDLTGFLTYSEQKQYEVEGVVRASGLVLSETGVRNIVVSAGVMWASHSRFTIDAIDTSGADTFSYWYRDGAGGWTRVVGQTQISNLYYDDGDGTLGTLGNNHYGVHWVYVTHTGELHVQYGQEDHNKLALAQAAKVPSAPDPLSKMATLIGRIIIKKNAGTFELVESAFDLDFVGSVVTDHNNLANIQGGTSGEYYHLTSVQHDNVLKREVQLVPFDWTTPVSTGDGKYYFHIGETLDGKNLSYCHAEVITAGTTGTLEIQIHNVTKAVDMLSTTLQIDSGETGSDTAATPYVIDTNNDDVAENDLLRIDIDAVQTTPPEGLIVTLGFS